MSEKLFAFAVLSGNIRRAVTAANHMDAATKAAIAHYNDPTDEPLNPGQIFSIIREGDLSEDVIYMATDRIMDAAGFSLKEAE